MGSENLGPSSQLAKDGLKTITRPIGWIGALAAGCAGSQPLNDQGVGGMHGIVWEWTLDFVSALSANERPHC
jgi:formylglycine-generating enzyme required for sulfatase activity